MPVQAAAGKSGSTWRPFECDEVCRGKDGKFDDDRRAERACARRDLPRVTPRPNLNVLMPGYMGRHAVPGLTHVAGRPVNPRIPLEDPEDGCPGSWVRSRLTMSVIPFMRSRTEHGNRVANPFFDACDDPFVWDLVLYAEEEQARHANRMREV